MNIFLILNLFPTSGLDHSLFPAIFLGLLLMVFFNECWGWPLSGMVIAGYLGPIFLISPWMGFIILFEAWLTYLLYLFLSDQGSRFGLWDSFFGRERFFVFLLLGILLRFFLEGLLAPYLSSLEVPKAHYLFSVGTILIPLIANAFWNSGFRNNFFSFFVVLILTYLLLRFLLIPYTNFSLQSFQASFEQFAIDLDSSVKMYMVLLCTAYLASGNNLKWGWDYGGIIVPALLALAWFSPARILLTIVEVTTVYFLARLFLPLFRRITLEGGRRILYVFMLDFLYKLAVGFYGGNEQSEGLDALYGFGYLLPSLIVLKIWNRGYWLTLRLVLQTSLTGAILGSVLASFFGFFSFSWDQPPKTQRLQRYLVWHNILQEYQHSEKILQKPPSSKEREFFEKAIELIDQAQQKNNVRILKRATTYAFFAGFSPTRNSTHFFLKENTNDISSKGLGTYYFNLLPSHPFFLEVLETQHQTVLEILPFLQYRLKPQGIFIGRPAFLKKITPKDFYSEDFRKNPYSFYLVARKQFRNAPYLRISQEKVKRPRLVLIKGTWDVFPIEELLKMWPHLEFIDKTREKKSEDLLKKYSQHLAFLQLPQKELFFEEPIVPFSAVTPVKGLSDRFIERMQNPYLKNPLRLKENVPEELRLNIFRPLYQFFEEFPTAYQNWKLERTALEEGLTNTFVDESFRKKFQEDFLGKRLFSPLNTLYLYARIFNISMRVYYWNDEYFLMFYQRGIRELFLFRLKNASPYILQASQIEKNPEIIPSSIQIFFQSSCSALILTGGAFQHNTHYHFFKQYLNANTFITLQTTLEEKTILRTSTPKPPNTLWKKAFPEEIYWENTLKKSTLHLNEKVLQYYQNQKFLWQELKPFFEKSGYFIQEEDSDKFLRWMILETQESQAKSAKTVFEFFKKNTNLTSITNCIQLIHELKTLASPLDLKLGAFYDPLTSQIAIFVGGKPRSYFIRFMAEDHHGQTEILWSQSVGTEGLQFLEKRQFCLILKEDPKKKKPSNK